MSYEKEVVYRIICDQCLFMFRIPADDMEHRGIYKMSKTKGLCIRVACPCCGEYQNHGEEPK